MSTRCGNVFVDASVMIVQASEGGRQSQVLNVYDGCEPHHEQHDPIFLIMQD